MSERSSKTTKARHVFKKHYSKLGDSLGTNMSIVVSQLYSSNLICSGTKDKITSDTTTPTFDKSLTLLNELEKRLSSQIFEDFLNVLCCDQIDLGHIAEPMRLEYQQLCEDSNHTESSNLVVGNEGSRFVAPGLTLSSQVRRVEGTESLCEAGKYQQPRPKHLHFSELAEDSMVKGSTSTVESPVQTATSGAELADDSERPLVPYGVPATTTPQSGSVAENRDELMMSFSRFVESVEEDNRMKVEEQVEYVKKDYELKCDQLKSKMEKVHKDEVDSLQGQVDDLMGTVNIYAIKNSTQKDSIKKMEKELESIHQELTVKTQEVEELRKTLADRESELDRVKALISSKEEELRQFKSSENKVPAVSPMSKRKTKLQTYEHLITLCEEIQVTLVELRDCPPEKITPSIMNDLKAKIEKIVNTKTGRWNTL